MCLLISKQFDRQINPPFLQRYRYHQILDINPLSLRYCLREPSNFDICRECCQLRKNSIISNYSPGLLLQRCGSSLPPESSPLEPCNVRLSLIPKIPRKRFIICLCSRWLFVCLSVWSVYDDCIMPGRLVFTGVLWANRIGDLLHFSYCLFLSSPRPLLAAPAPVCRAPNETRASLYLRGWRTFCRCSPERRAVALHILNISERIPRAPPLPRSGAR